MSFGEHILFDTQNNNNQLKHIKFVVEEASSYHDLIFIFDVLKADIAHFLFLGHLIIEPVVEDLQNEGALHAVFRLRCGLDDVIRASVVLGYIIVICRGYVAILGSLLFLLLLETAQGYHALRPFTQYLQNFDRLHLLFYLWCLLGAAGAVQAPLATGGINCLFWCAVGSRTDNFVVLVPVAVIRVASLG